MLRARRLIKPKPESRPNATERGYNYAWRKFATSFLDEFPLCEDCQQVGRTALATEVHHVVPVRVSNDIWQGPFRGLCKPCHSIRTNRGE